MFLIFGVISGLIFSESVSAEEEKAVLDHIASSDMYFSGYMLVVGDEEGWEETQCCIYDNMSYLVAYNDNAEAILIASEPDWDSVDIYTAGIYDLDFSMELCEEDTPYCELDSSIQNVVIPVCVSDPEEFELFPARTTEQQHRLMEKQLIMQTNYTHQLNVQIEERRRAVHDFRHHMRVVQTMAEKCGNQEIPENLQANVRQRRQPLIVRCCLKNSDATVPVLAILQAQRCGITPFQQACILFPILRN